MVCDHTLRKCNSAFSHPSPCNSEERAALYAENADPFIIKSIILSLPLSSVTPKPHLSTLTLHLFLFLNFFLNIVLICLYALALRSIPPLTGHLQTCLLLLFLPQPPPYHPSSLSQSSGRHCPGDTAAEEWGGSWVWGERGGQTSEEGQRYQEGEVGAAGQTDQTGCTDRQSW